MEFSEKLQNLRKTKKLTQEQLAEVLFVSRTAISKWESGRGYPNIDSLQDIANYFSVSIDELLSSEKLISIAKDENKSNIRKMCNLLFSITDLFWFLLVFLPLYPNEIDGFVYSVSLLNYKQSVSFAYFTLFGIAFAFGVLQLIFVKLNLQKQNKIFAMISLILNVLTVVFLVITRVVYASVIAFLFLIIKGVAIFKKL